MFRAFFRELLPALLLLLVLTLLCGLAYPLAVTGLAQLLFPQRLAEHVERARANSADRRAKVYVPGDENHGRRGVHGGEPALELQPSLWRLQVEQ